MGGLAFVRNLAVGLPDGSTVVEATSVDLQAGRVIALALGSLPFATTMDAVRPQELDLMAALNNARDDADRVRIQAELQKQQERTAAARRGLSGASGGRASKPAGAACNCTPGDPLCSCL